MAGPPPALTQGLKLDTDIAALMDGEGTAGTACAPGAAAPATQPQLERVQAAERPAAVGQEQEQQLEEEEPESMVDFLLKRQLSPASPTGPAGSGGPSPNGAMADVSPPGAWNSVGPLRCWHPVGSGEAAVAHVAQRLAGMEVRGCWRGFWLCLLERRQWQRVRARGAGRAGWCSTLQAPCPVSRTSAMPPQAYRTCAVLWLHLRCAMVADHPPVLPTGLARDRRGGCRAGALPPPRVGCG